LIQLGTMICSQFYYPQKHLYLQIQLQKRGVLRIVPQLQQEMFKNLHMVVLAATEVSIHLLEMFIMVSLGRV